MWIKQTCAVIAVIPALFAGSVQAQTAPALGEEAIALPAYSAFALPLRNSGVAISKEKGIEGWSDTKTKLLWYSGLKTTGNLVIALQVRLPATATSQFHLTVERLGKNGEPLAQTKKTLTAKATGAATESRVSFGTLKVSEMGYYRFMVEGVSRTGDTFGSVQSLNLEGPAVVGAVADTEGLRGAPSVHLNYVLPAPAKFTAFYNEVTGETTPLHSYYCAIGFQRGYMGIQVNSPTERRIIFSVWDSGKEAVDRGKVSEADKVQLLAKGKSVVADSFGNEGTGGHSHLVYPWKQNQTYRILITSKAEADGSRAVYSGYFYFPETKRWELIARFRAPQDAGVMTRFYSFSEEFSPDNGYERRRAAFGNQWACTPDGKWVELTGTKFTRTSRESKARMDFDGGVDAAGRFFLSNGGFFQTSGNDYGTMLTRPAKNHPPTDIDFSKLP